MTGWKELLDGKDAESPIAAPDLVIASDEALPPLPDPSAYKPYHLQRGPSRPAMFLDLRRFDARAGTLVGSMLSYPSLVAIDYFDDTIIDLNFGLRNIRIEGKGLGELIQRLQTGSVLFIQQYTHKIWPERPTSGPIVDKIVDMGLATGH